MSDLMIPQNFDLNLNGLTIETTDGEQITLQPGQSVMDLLPGGGGGEPLWRLNVTQNHRDDRLPGQPDTLFLSRRVRRTDDQGEQIRESEIVPLGHSLRAWPLGMTANRSYFAAKYDPNNPAEAPDCRSETFLAPDAAYLNKYASACARLDPKTGKLVATCPIAQWGPKGENGKAAPPKCHEQYVLFLAVSIERQHEAPEMAVCEAYFKSTSASAGKTAIQTLRAIMARGAPIWQHPIDILVRPAGVGMTYVPLVRTDVRDSENFNDDDRAGLLAAVQRADEALRFRLERSQKVDEAPAGNGNEPPRPAPREQEIVQEAAPVGAAAAPGANGKRKTSSKAIDPLI